MPVAFGEEGEKLFSVAVACGRLPWLSCSVSSGRKVGLRRFFGVFARALPVTAIAEIKGIAKVLHRFARRRVAWQIARQITRHIDRRAVAGHVAKSLLAAVAKTAVVVGQGQSLLIGGGAAFKAFLQHGDARQHAVQANGPVAQNRAASIAGVYPVGAAKTLARRNVALVSLDGEQCDGFDFSPA